MTTEILNILKTLVFKKANSTFYVILNGFNNSGLQIKMLIFTMPLKITLIFYSEMSL